MKKLRYVSLHHLHHSTFSHGDGHKLPKVHVARAVELGYTAMALTEHGGSSSHFQFEKAAIELGLKPIFGLEGYTGPVDKESRTQFKYHLTILARSNNGYKNLNQLITQSWKDFSYHPTISGDNLQRNSGDLYALSGCTGSMLACALVGGKGIPVPTSRDGYGWDDARRIISRFARLFGERYFLEVQPFYELEKTCRINPAYERLSRESGVPLVATCDVHYPRPEDGEMQAILHAVHRGNQSIDDAMRSWNYDVPMTLPESDKALGERLMKTGLSRAAAWEAILNTEWIASQCTVTLPKASRLVYPIKEDDWKPWS